LLLYEFGIIPPELKNNPRPSEDIRGEDRTAKSYQVSPTNLLRY